MDPTTEIQDDNNQGETQVDPWAEAFAKVAQGDQGDTAPTASADGQSEGDQGSEEPSGKTLSGNAQLADSAQDEAPAGGLADNAGEAGHEDVQAQGDPEGSGQRDVDFSEYESALKQNINSKVIKDVSDAFLRRGNVRHTNGQLGATLNDPDICKRDADGVPRFYNPDTGREFTGDNPRRQAQEWVDDYNRDLAQAFNKTCAEYEAKLMKEQQPMLDLIKFEPKYDALDEVRQGMLDDLLQDYEIKDANGDVVGYSCDLDKALAAVNRQVASIQARYGKPKQQQQASPEPSQDQGTDSKGPALDIKSAAGDAAKAGERKINSIADGLLVFEDAKLAKMKEGK